MADDTAPDASRLATRRTAATGRDAKYQQRYDEILDAAAAVFAEKGYHGASTKDIADRLGIRQGSLYYYFSSKQEALAEVCIRGVQDFVTTLTVIAERDAPVNDRVREGIAAHLSPMLSYRAYVKVFLKDRKDLEAENRSKVGAPTRAYEAVWMKLMEEGKARGDVRKDLPTKTIVFGLLGMMNATFDWFEGTEKDLEDIADAYTRILQEGLRPR